LARISSAVGALAAKGRLAEAIATRIRDEGITDIFPEFGAKIRLVSVESRRVGD
jgi:hypothetical protein